MHYNPPGIRGEPRYLEGVARFTKLHGSWTGCGARTSVVSVCRSARTSCSLFEGARSHGASPTKLMIYPNAAKDRETLAYPYVELFAICRRCVPSQQHAGDLRLALATSTSTA